MSWFKKMKKTFVFKAAKAVGRTTAKAVKYAAPVVGGVLGGPLGAGIGTAIGAGAAQVGPTKNAGAQLKRSIVFGGAVTLGTGALGLVSGQGVGATLFQSVGSIFGGGGTGGKGGLESSFWNSDVAPTTDQPGDWTKGLGGLDKGFMNPSKPGQSPSGGPSFSLLPNFNPFGQTPGKIGGDPEVGDPRQGSGGLLDQLVFGPPSGEPGFFETEEGGPDYLKIGLVAGAAWFLFFRKRAA